MGEWLKPGVCKTPARKGRVGSNPTADSMAEFVIIYTWPDGREEVRYRRVPGSVEAKELMDEVDALKIRLGDECPYSYRVEQ